MLEKHYKTFFFLKELPLERTCLKLENDTNVGLWSCKKTSQTSDTRSFFCLIEATGSSQHLLLLETHSKIFVAQCSADDGSRSHSSGFTAVTV